MTAFVKLQMFKNQNSRKENSGSTLETAVPFLGWKTGYLVRSKGGETFTITQINSTDGAMHYQDCNVELVNEAGEKRLLKGSTLQTGYSFVSKGDVKENEGAATSTEREDCTTIILNVAGIREFYPRKRGEGTRVLMQDKTAYIVADETNAVWMAIKRSVAEASGRPMSGRLDQVLGVTENVGSMTR